MANFDAYFPQLLKFEGGYVDNPADPGGATNLGITLGTFQRYAYELLGVAPTLQNLRDLRPDQAAVIYRKMYWDPIDGDAIALQLLAEIVFDFYVNAGYHAIALLQELLGPSIAEDGRFGPQTLAALQRADQVALYARYRQGRIDYYRNLASAHPVLQRFLAGWLNRVLWFPAQAGANVAAPAIAAPAITAAAAVTARPAQIPAGTVLATRSGVPGACTPSA